jgi:murein DD-endopeptidase MepM/ murein hydrolase activator NlpD
VGVDHGNGYQTWYGHLANEPYVEVGQVVWQGGYLGPMGNTGKSTGPHLHFIIMKDGVYQNPQHYLD